MSNKSTGARYERKLVNALRGQGYFAKRAGSSGAGGSGDSYDVIAAKNGKTCIIEQKYSSTNRCSIEYEEVHGVEDPDGPNGLNWIAEMFGGTALLVGRFSGDTTFYAMTPSQCYQTPGGTYVIRKQDRQDAMVLASA